MTAQAEPAERPKATAEGRARRVPRPRSGIWVVAGKEMADHLLSLRFLILLALIALATLGAVYAAAGGLRSVAPEATGTPALFLRLFTVSVEEGQIPPFFVVVGLLAPLLGIALGFDAVSGERSAGTLPRLLSQPIHRDAVINGKFVAGLAVIAVILASVTLLVAGFGILRLGIAPTLEEVLRIAAWLAVAILYAGVWLAFSLLCSVLVRRAATAAFLAIAAWLVLTLFAARLTGIVADALAPVPANPTFEEVLANAELEQALSRLSPSTLFSEATLVLLTPQARSAGFIFEFQLVGALPDPLPLGQSLLIIWPQVVGLLALAVACFGAAYVAFMRQEIRA
ncbi:MAG TPA: ABC transporter permease [Candidatus Limnocylindria bacterium]|nr:ABC transporter permease [Candidatus Limnocylindria bacterium]